MLNDCRPWADARLETVGCSELAALFGGEGADGFTSEYELYHGKTGGLPKADLGNDVLWGSLLEPSVIEGTRRVLGWDSVGWSDVRPSMLAPPAGVSYVETERGLHLRHPCGLGGTPDGIVRREFALWLLEIKIASTWALEKWPGKGEGLPDAYLLQVWGYLGLLGLARALVAVFVLERRELKTYEVEAQPAMFALICERVAAFWNRVRRGDEPEPDLGRDADAVARRWRSLDRVGAVDWSGSPALCAMVAEYRAARDSRLSAEKVEEARKAMLLHRMGSAERVIAGRLTVSTTGNVLRVKEHK